MDGTSALSPLHITSPCVCYISVHTHVHDSAHTHICTWMHKVGIGWIYWSFSTFFFFETRSFTTDPETHAVPTLLVLRLQGCTTTSGFLRGFWGLNSGPFAFMADIWLTEPAISPALVVQAIVWHSPTCVSSCRNRGGHTYLVDYSEDEMMS